MLTRTLIVSLLLLASASCGIFPASAPQVIEVPPPKLGALPERLLKPRVQNFVERMQNLLSSSPEKPTK